jgi:hypothetical protein
MTTTHILSIILATVAQFAVGAIWYMPLFGKAWGEIHCFDKLSKKAQKEMQVKMGPYYGVQIAVTLITSVVLSQLILLVPEISAYALATMLWVGFVVPTQVAAVIFGGTEGKWIGKKIAIMAGGSLVCLLVATAVLTMVK